MRRYLFVTLSILAGLTVVFAAYSYRINTSPKQPPGDSGSVVFSADSSSLSPLSTRNVSYIGTIEKIEISIYQQGTHQMTLPDGSLLLLKSNDANLDMDTYLGKRVEVRGAVQPTAQGNALAMSVEEVTLIEDSSESGDASARSFAICGGITGIRCKPGFECIDDPSDSCDPEKGGADCSGICIPVSTGSLSSSPKSGPAAVSSSKSSEKTSLSVSSVPVASSRSPESSSSSAAGANTNEQQIVALMNQRYDDQSLWTQSYCTSHIAFCIPVHKNWYFKSFGATTSNLWHVEFGIATIDTLNQGAVVLSLVSGASDSAGGADGQIKIQGNDIVGYKDWTDGNHFELIADSRLRAPVTYMLSHITPYNPGD